MIVGGEPPLPYQLDVRPSQDFSYEGAKTKLLNLDSILAGHHVTSLLVPGDAFTYSEAQDHEHLGSTDRQGKLLLLSSWIDLENRIGVGCMGAVLTYLQKRRAADYLPNDPNAEELFRVRSLEMFSLRDTM
jgi:DNA mismatch repair protein MSH5